MVTYQIVHMGSIKKPKSPSRITVQVSQEMTVRQLTNHLVERGDVVGVPGDYGEDPVLQLLVIVNGVNARLLNGPDTVLKDGDSVAVLVPLIGG